MPTETPADRRPATRGRRRRIVFRLLAVAIVLGVSLLAMEIALRLLLPMHPSGWFARNAHPDLYYLPTPGISYELWGHSYTHNAQSLRDTVPRDPDRDAVRVAFVGDSVCYGSGVSDGETVADATGELLGPGVECLNFGVPGYNTHQVNAMVRDRVAGWRGVRAVVYVFSENDLILATYGRAALLCPQHLVDLYEKPGSSSRQLLKRSVAAQWVYSRLLRQRRGERAAGDAADDAAGDRDEDATGDTGAAPVTDTPDRPYPHPFGMLRDLMLTDSTHRRRFADLLADTATWSREHDVALVLLYSPSRPTVERDTDGLYAQALREIASDVGIEMLDATPAFRAADRPGMELWCDPGHPSAAGHRLLAETAATWLRAQPALAE